MSSGAMKFAKFSMSGISWSISYWKVSNGELLRNLICIAYFVINLKNNAFENRRTVIYRFSQVSTIRTSRLQSLLALNDVSDHVEDLYQGIICMAGNVWPLKFLTVTVLTLSKYLCMIIILWFCYFYYYDDYSLRS